MEGVLFSLEEVVGLITKQPAEVLESLKIEDGDVRTKDDFLPLLKRAQKDSLDKVVKDEKGQATRHRMKQAQDYIREKHGVESNSDRFEDHIEALVENIKGKAGKEVIVEKTVELTKEMLLKNHIVHEILNEAKPTMVADVQKKLEEKDKEFQAYVGKDHQKKIDRGLYEEAEKTLIELKADLEKEDSEAGKEKRKNQINLVVAGLKNMYSYRLNEETDKPIPLNKEGEPLREDYTDITVKNLVERINPYRTLKFDQDKSSSGATSQTTSNTQRHGVPVPKTVSEYTAALAAEPDSAKRKAIMEAFNAAQEKK